MSKYIEFSKEFVGNEPYITNKYILKRISNTDYDFLELSLSELFINIYATISGIKHKVRAYIIGHDKEHRMMDILIHIIDITGTLIDIPTNSQITIEIHNEVAIYD